MTEQPGKNNNHNLSHMQEADLNCEICGCDGMALSLFYCDNYVYGCTGARHAHCLRPPQQTVEGGGWTIGGWFCNLCSKHTSKGMTVGKKKITEKLEAEGDNYMQQCENDEKKVKALNKVVGEKVTKEEEEKEEADEQLEEDEVLGAVQDHKKEEKKLESQKKKNKGDEGKEKQEEDEEEKVEEEEAEDDEYEYDAMTMALPHIQKKIAVEKAKQIKYKSLVQNVEEREWYINQHDNEGAGIATIGSDARGPWSLQELYRFADMMGRSDGNHGEVFRASFEDLVVNRGNEERKIGEEEEVIHVGDLLDAMQ
jgi:hypothetical protein